MRLALLQLYRLGVLVLIAWLVREHHTRLRVAGDAPVAVEEVATFFPTARSLQLDHSERQGWSVFDGAEKPLGYVVRTQPLTRAIKGYRGVTDTLVAFDPQWRVLGVKIRRSEDTRTHVGDVVEDRHFLKTWNGMSWDNVAALDLKKAGIEGVSGATLTSMAVAESLTHRLALANQARALPFRIRARDIGLAVVVVLALALAFTRAEGRRGARRGFQVLVVVYVGFINGDLLAQSLLAGWAQSGVNWRLAPGMVLLAAAAFLVPWVAKKPVYCQHICPHGALQEWLGKLGTRRRVNLSANHTRLLRWLPFGLLVMVVVAVMLQLPLDLADIEPFDAYILRAAGWATLSVAVVGLVVSYFIPQAYCKFGCPTGALLEFVRARGAQDRFGRRDAAAAFLVALTALLFWKYDVIQPWLFAPK